MFFVYLQSNNFMKKNLFRTLTNVALMMAIMTVAIGIRAQSVNMSRYITLTVQTEQLIKLDLKGMASETPIRIESGAQVLDTVISSTWTGYKNYLSDGTTMTIYGDITQFDCDNNNNEKITAIDVNNDILERLYCRSNTINSMNIESNSALRRLYFSNNSLTSLNLSSSTNLIYVTYFGNLLNDCALDSLFASLPER